MIIRVKKKIGNQLIRLICFSIAASLTLVFFLYGHLSEISNSGDKFVLEYKKVINDNHDLLILFEQSDKLFGQYIRTGYDLDTAVLKNDIQNLRTDFEHTLQNIIHFDSHYTGDYSALQTAYEYYIDQCDQLMNEADQAAGGYQNTNPQFSITQEAYRNVINEFKTINDHSEQILHKDIDNNNRISEKAQRIYTSGTVLLVVIMILSIVIIIKNLSLPLKKTRANMEKTLRKIQRSGIGQKNMTPKGKIKKRDDLSALNEYYRQLMIHFSEMTEQTEEQCIHLKDKLVIINNRGKKAVRCTESITGMYTVFEQGKHELSICLAMLEEFAKNFDNSKEQANQDIKRGTEISEDIAKRSENIRNSSDQSKRLLDDRLNEVIKLHTKAKQSFDEVSRIDALSKTMLDTAEEISMLAIEATLEASKIGEVATVVALVIEKIRLVINSNREAVQELQEIDIMIRGRFQELESGVSDMISFFSHTNDINYQSFQSIGDHYENDAKELHELFYNLEMLNNYYEVLRGKIADGNLPDDIMTYENSMGNISSNLTKIYSILNSINSSILKCERMIDAIIADMPHDLNIPS